MRSYALSAQANSTDRLIDAIVALDPSPRTHRWSSISLCVLDAVWSIGANYDSVVTPLVHRFAAAYAIPQALVPIEAPLPAESFSLPRLASLNVDELVAVTNRQRTSTRGGIVKAEAAVHYAQILASHQVETLDDGMALLSRSEDVQVVDDALARVPGDGQFGVRRGYLWMLIGDDERIKPDRMVLRLLSRIGLDVDPLQAERLILGAVASVSTELGRNVTAWEIDHAIWSAARAYGR